MKKIAMIKNGIVENISIWDGRSKWSPDGYTLINITDNPKVDIGWLYDGHIFTAPDRVA